MESFFILAFIILVFFIFLTGFYLFQLKKRVDVFFQKGDENFEKLISSQMKKIEEQEADIQTIKKDISGLDKISKLSFQRIGLVRFNPFKEVGGDQSFSVVLLDFNNNGFVITSIYSRDGNRVYAKAINNGKSQYSLSNEENEAIKMAMG
ncbi:DUF4446 family protein [Patescibacteria group bacterium]|nr:DUF4446 family protein [Patescibacteria group bacterium]